MRQSRSDVYLFQISLVLEHGNTWFGKRSCCFVIYVNLHKLPLYSVSICIKMAPAGTFSRKRSEGFPCGVGGLGVGPVLASRCFVPREFS